MSERGDEEGAVVDERRLEELLEVVGAENFRVIEDVLDVFERNAPAQIAAVQAAVRSGEGEAVAAAAHSLKSSAANLGVTRLRERADQIERQGRAGDLAGLDALAADLLEIQARGARALRAWFEESRSRPPSSPPSALRCG